MAKSNQLVKDANLQSRKYLAKINLRTNLCICDIMTGIIRCPSAKTSKNAVLW